jgi:hypothetical protein
MSAMVQQEYNVKIARFAILGLVVALLCGLGAVTAKADTLSITVLGPVSGTAHNYNLFLPTGVTPTAFSSNNDFEFNGIAWTIDGSGQAPTILDFYSSGMNGGLSFGFGGSFINLFGTQLYTGTTASTFALIVPDTVTLNDASGALFVASIIDPPSTPEASTLLSLGLGLGALIGVFCWTRKQGLPAATVA